MGSVVSVVSRSAQRISNIVAEVNSIASRFVFYADCKEFVGKALYTNTDVLIVDNYDGKENNLSGYFKEIKKIKNKSEMVIVLIINGYGDSESIEALRAGADDYLCYSMVRNELLARVERNTKTTALDDDAYFESRFGVDLRRIFPIYHRVILQSSLNYIDENIANIKGVYDLSFYLNKVERDINSIFIEHIGKSAFEYIRDVRMEKSKEMLLKTRHTITRISEEVGYSSAANFSTAFKNVVGCSPREYRRSIFEK